MTHLKIHNICYLSHKSTSLSLSLSLSLLFVPRTPPLSPLYITSLSTSLSSLHHVSLSLSFAFPEPHLSPSVLSLQSPCRKLHVSLSTNLICFKLKNAYMWKSQKLLKKNKERKWIFIYLFLYRMNKPNRFCISFNNFISSSIRVCPTSNFDFHFNTIMCAQFICST